MPPSVARGSTWKCKSVCQLRSAAVWCNLWPGHEIDNGNPGDMISFGFSARHWQQIEAGRPITVTTLLRICDTFRVPMARLVRGLDKGLYGN